MLTLLSVPTPAFTPGVSAYRSSHRSSAGAFVVSCAEEGPSPEAWREFRQKLVSGGLKLTTDEEEASDEGARASVAAAERRAVAPKNEELLKSQSSDLYEEYITGGWAHTSPVEAGGLMMRLPLPAQFVQQMRDGSTAHWPEKLRQKIKAELPEAEDGGLDSDALLQKWTANTMYSYKVAEAMMEQRIRDIGAMADGNGRIDARSLKPEELEMLRLFSEAQNAWQQVCLVLSASGSEATASVVLNRPLAKAIDAPLGLVLVNGRKGSLDDADCDRVAAKLAKAFGDEAAVYWGGPERQDEAGLLVHGVEGLAGSEELAPGMRIFTCSGLDVEAAADAILDGRAAPLDFRWFIGRHCSLRCDEREWVAAACARPVALKQCLGLPKPLWHEVMELCGDWCAELSQIEIQKRTDLED